MRRGTCTYSSPDTLSAIPVPVPIVEITTQDAVAIETRREKAAKRPKVTITCSDRAAHIHMPALHMPAAHVPATPMPAAPLRYHIDPQAAATTAKVVKSSVYPICDQKKTPPFKTPPSPEPEHSAIWLQVITREAAASHCCYAIP